MEEGDDVSQWRELESATEGFDMWIVALHAGTTALIKYAPDERIGPREDAGDDEDAAPVRLCDGGRWLAGSDSWRER